MWRYGPRLSQLSPQSGNLIHSPGRLARGGTTIILPHWKSMSSKLFMENILCVELLSLQAVGIYTGVWLHKSCIATISTVTCDCDEWCACVGVFVCVFVCVRERERERERERREGQIFPCNQFAPRGIV